MKYLNNKYTRVYNKIVENALDRTLPTTQVTETHHIIPKCLGGPDTKDNLVVLKPREHFICHWLLTKMVTTKKHEWQTMNALGFMLWAENDKQERYKVTPRIYEQLKTKHSKLKSWAMSGSKNPNYGKKWSQERKDAMSRQNKGMKLTEDQIEKIRQSKLGKKRSEFSDKWRTNLSKAKSGSGNGMYGKSQSEESRRKIGEGQRGRKHTPEEIEKRAAFHRGRKRSSATIQKMKDAWIKRKRNEQTK